MKIRSKELSDTDRMETFDALYTAVGTLRGRDAAKQFLRNILTESERIMLGRRILIARELLGGATYDDIVEDYGVGRDTITRIARWLDEQLPGYEKVLADMAQELKDRNEKFKDRKKYATSALYRLKKKYPMHFLLFPPHKR